MVDRIFGNGARQLTAGINDARLSYITVLAPRRTHYIYQEGVRRGVIPADVRRHWATSTFHRKDSDHSDELLPTVSVVAS